MAYNMDKKITHIAEEIDELIDEYFEETHELLSVQHILDLIAEKKFGDHKE